MGFNSLWLEDAEAPPVYVMGMGIGKPIGQMSLSATLGALALAATAYVVTPGSMSLTATLSALTSAAVISNSVPVYVAVRDIINAGLNVYTIRERNNAVPYDYVISWSPPIGTELPPYSVVTLTVSDGPVNALPVASAVPNVTGLTTSAASAILAAGGWSVGQYTWEIDSSDAGTVIAQSPAAGVDALPGTTITLTVSLGPTTVTPPVPVPS